MVPHVDRSWGKTCKRSKVSNLQWPWVPSKDLAWSAKRGRPAVSKLHDGGIEQAKLAFSASLAKLRLEKKDLVCKEHEVIDLAIADAVGVEELEPDAVLGIRPPLADCFRHLLLVREARYPAPPETPRLR